MTTTIATMVTATAMIATTDPSIMTPSVVNQWVSRVKDTSLAYIMGVTELSFVATQVNSRLMVYPAEVFAFVTLIYFVMCSALEWLCTKWLGKPLRPAPRAGNVTRA
ncbi:polar amino acid ABC transporter, inner membrane subunit [Pandoraea communis]|uniref:Polar amino acid ABC transporter, inner membrane subunit n=1 Tax=Pandoraea communis TaxID=2508297 RepID=A0A5E4TQC0_9BURK|nr:polar amino acid ABC transporter, inner membrane subunit [Pandoraea communis]